MKNKLGQEPAFPTPDYILQNSGELNYNPIGISKRLYIATMAMQGLLSAQNANAHGVDAEWTTKTAFNIADCMLKQENE